VPQLTELASRFDLLAVISGRKAGALREIIDIPVSNISAITDGMVGKRSGRTAPGRYSLAVLYARVAAELETLLSIDASSFRIMASISVHYNTTQQPSTAKQQILDFLEKSPHIKTAADGREDKHRIVPRLDIDKGTASPVLFSNTISGEQSISGMTSATCRIPRHPGRPGKARIHGLTVLVAAAHQSELLHEVDFTLDGVTETETF